MLNLLNAARRSTSLRMIRHELSYIVITSYALLKILLHHGKKTLRRSLRGMEGIHRHSVVEREEGNRRLL